MKKHKLVKHDRYLSVSELERLGAALKAVEAEGASAFAIAAIRFLALPGCRRSEAPSMQWGAETIVAASTWKTLGWRRGIKGRLTARFAALAHSNCGWQSATFLDKGQ